MHLTRNVKRAGAAGYISVGKGKAAAIILFLICSFAVAWATRSGNGKTAIAVKPVQPPTAHTKQPATRMGHGTPATHQKVKAGGKAGTQHQHGASHQQGAQPHNSVRGSHAGQQQSHSTRTPSPEKSPSPTPDTAPALSPTATPAPFGTSS